MSCSNYINKTDGVNSIPNVEYITFSLSITQSKTYVTDSHFAIDENKINSVYLFIFNDADTFEKREHLNSFNFTPYLKDEFTSNKAIATTVGAKIFM